MMRAAKIFAVAVAIFAILNPGDCQVPPEDNLTIIQQGRPASRSKILLIDSSRVQYLSRDNLFIIKLFGTILCR